MPKIIKAYEGAELTPKIEVSSNAFKITLPNRTASSNKAESLAGTPKDNEKLILDFISLNGHIVRSDVDQLLDVSQATANRILKTHGCRGLDLSGRKR